MVGHILRCCVALETGHWIHILNPCKQAKLHGPLETLKAMEQQGAPVSRDNAYHLLQECSIKEDLQLLRRVHLLTIHAGIDSISALGDHLIRAFCSHENLIEANQAFHKVINPTQYTWAAIILANSKLGQVNLVFEMHHRNQFSNIKPDMHIYLGVLKSCTLMSAITKGRMLHSQMTESEPDPLVWSALVNMYAKCGALEEAGNVFIKLQNRDVVSWGTMISAYAQNGKCSLALECFHDMQEEGMRPDLVCWGALIAGYAQYGDGHLALKYFEKMQQEGIKPNQATFSSAIKACAVIGAIEEGRLMHSAVMQSELQSDILVASSVIDMYAKCGSLKEASKLLDQQPNKNVVSWNGMVAGYNQQGKGLLALECAQIMEQEGLKPDGSMFSNLLVACISIKRIAQGRLLHERVMESGFHVDVVVGNTLVNLYAKCGSLHEAYEVFKKMPYRDLVTWNAMITTYTQNGEPFLSFECFQKMQELGIEPNELSFTSILSACSRAGLEDEGLLYFKSMEVNYGMMPTASHYSCVIGLLARSSYLPQAIGLLKSTIGTDVMGWTSLLSACRIHGDIELGKHCFDQLVYLDPHCTAGYDLMANSYAQR